MANTYAIGHCEWAFIRTLQTHRDMATAAKMYTEKHLWKQKPSLVNFLERYYTIWHREYRTYNCIYITTTVVQTIGI